MFYSKKCGAIKSVKIEKHRKRKATFDKAKYALVEFAHKDSVEVCCGIKLMWMLLRKNLSNESMQLCFRAIISWAISYSMAILASPKIWTFFLSFQKIINYIHGIKLVAAEKSPRTIVH